MGVTTKQTGLNIASQWTQHIINIVVNFFLIGYVVAKVGPEHYGGWTTIVSIIGYLSILSAGMSVAVQHYVARFSAKQDQAGLISAFSSSYAVYGIGAVIAFLVCLWVSFVYPSVFPKVPENAAIECSIALRWVAVSMFLLMLSLPMQGTLLGLQQHHIRNSIEIISLIARAVTVVLLFNLLKPSLIYLGTAFFLAMCTRFLLCKIALWRIAPELQFRPSTIKKDTLAQLFTYGGHSFVWTICIVIARDSIPVLATIIINPEAATFWYVGNRLVVSIGGLIKGVGRVFVPVASSLYASEKWGGLKVVLIRSTRFCALFSLSGVVALIMFGQDLLNFWVGPGYSISYYVLVITALGWVGSWTFGGAQAILMGMRKLWFVTIMVSSYAIAGILLAVIMASTWGVLGLAAGFAIPIATIYAFPIPYFASKSCKVRLRKLLTSALSAPVGISLIMVLCIIVIQRILPAVNIVNFIAQLIIALVIFGVLVLLFGLDPASRDMLLGKFGARQTKPL